MKKQQIIDIMIKYQETFHGSGSCGELGDAVQAIDVDDLSDIADEIIELDCNYKGARIGYSNTEKSYFIGSWFNSPVELFQTISDLKFGFN